MMKKDLVYLFYFNIILNSLIIYLKIIYNLSDCLYKTFKKYYIYFILFFI